MGVTIATLGSHSALEVCDGTKQQGLKNLVVCERGREKPYTGMFRTRQRKLGHRRIEVGCVDDVMLVDKFRQIHEPRTAAELVRRATIFVPNRSYFVYSGDTSLERAHAVEKFPVPTFGNKNLLRAEERDLPKNQHFLLEKAGIPTPEVIHSVNEIRGPCMVKVSEKERNYERAFFVTNSPEDYGKKSEELIAQGKITREGLNAARMEGYSVGALFNLNFFYSPIFEQLELLGTDMRRQVNLDGFLHMPAAEQLEASRVIPISRIEVGHVATTLRESLLQQAVEMGERFVEACKEHYKPGIIGPFALQSMVVEKNGKEAFEVFDVSTRIAGSPGTRFTHLSRAIHRKDISIGERIAMEVHYADETNQLRALSAPA